MTNLEALSQEIRAMTRRTKLYKTLKEELTKLGYWKNKGRGKPNDNIGRAIYNDK